MEEVDKTKDEIKSVLGHSSTIDDIETEMERLTDDMSNSPTESLDESFNDTGPQNRPTIQPTNLPTTHSETSETASQRNSICSSGLSSFADLTSSTEHRTMSPQLIAGMMTHPKVIQQTFY